MLVYLQNRSSSIAEVIPLRFHLIGGLIYAKTILLKNSMQSLKNNKGLGFNIG
jgi:hypothetical protein